MKLYHLHQENYGDEWFVMAESREQALNSILLQIKEEYKGNDWGTYKLVQTFIDKGKVGDYVLDEYEVNQAVRSEVS